jgi:predicted amidophosphoribosyltransferase
MVTEPCRKCSEGLEFSGQICRNCGTIPFHYSKKGLLVKDPSQKTKITILNNQCPRCQTERPFKKYKCPKCGFDFHLDKPVQNNN